MLLKLECHPSLQVRALLKVVGVSKTTGKRVPELKKTI